METLFSSYYYLRRLIFLVIILFIFSCNQSSKAIPKAVNGVVDLKDWDFESDGIVKMDGEWEFYPFVLPNYYGEVPEENKNYLEVPKFWNGFVYGEKDGKPREMNGLGYGTYRLKILTMAKEVGIKTSNQATAFSLYCDKEIILQSGVVGETAESSIPSKKIPILKTCEVHGGELNLTMAISNFHTLRGGYWHSIQLGSPAQMLEKRDRDLGLDLFLAGILFIMGSYHISIFSLRREDRTTAYFGLLCLLSTIRTLLVGENYLFDLFPSLSFEFGLKLEFLTAYLGIPIFLEFLNSLFPLEISSIIRKSVHWICLILSIIVAFIPPFYFARTLPIFLMILFFSICSMDFD